jgi:outer membrane autotransporter protein
VKNGCRTDVRDSARFSLAPVLDNRVHGRQVEHAQGVFDCNLPIQFGGSATRQSRISGATVLLLSVSCIALVQAWCGEARAIVFNNNVAPNTAAAADIYDSADIYPNVVNVNGCTGTLINSRTILTAAHCFWDAQSETLNAHPPIQIKFGADINTATRYDTTAVGLQLVNGYRDAVTGNDMAVVTLSTPVTAIKPVVLVGHNSPTPPTGSLMITVGYGQYGTGNDGGAYSSNVVPGIPPAPSDPIRRRFGETLLGAFEDWTFDRTPVAPQLIAQFRNPQSRANPDLFNLNGLGFSVPPNQAGNGAGDSGGPLFWVQPDGSLIQVGVLGTLNSDTASVPGTVRYGTIMGWTSVQEMLSFLDQFDPLRQVTAVGGNFSWSNPNAWNDSVLGMIGEVPNNRNGSFTPPYGDAGRFFQVQLTQPGQITLDMNPTIDTLEIDGAQSQLVLPAGFTLSTVLSTTLSAGTLTMSGGTLSSPEMLLSGGLLTGNGTIISNGGDTGLCATGVCNTGGRVIPVGTLSIQGNYTQTGGVLAYQLSPSGASGNLFVSGIATLGGALDVSITPGLYGLSTHYAGVLTAGAVNGQFAEVSSSPSAFLTLETIYNPTSVDLTLDRVPFGAVPGLSANQRAVGNALEAGYSTNLTGQQALFYENILASPTTNVLTQLSGESNAGAGQIAAFQLNSEFLLLMLNPYGLDRGGFGPAASGPRGGAISRFAPERETSPEVAQAYAAVTPPTRTATYWTPRWNVWAAAFGGANNTNGDPAGAGTHSFAARTAGIAAGLDYNVTPDTLIGFALAGGDTGWGLAQGLGGGHGDAFQAGLYGSHVFGPAYLSGALAFANYWMASSRSVVMASIDTLNANFDAQSWAGRAEAGYKLAWAPVNLTPYAAVQAQSFRTPNFSEASTSGSNLYALSYAPHTGSVTRAELGSWFSNNYLLAGDAVAVLYGRAAWAHDWQNSLQASPIFLTLPTASFIVNGAKPASDLAVVTAGAELRLAGGISLMGKFDGEFGPGTNTYAGTGRLRYVW